MSRIFLRHSKSTLPPSNVRNIPSRAAVSSQAHSLLIASLHHNNSLSYFHNTANVCGFFHPSAVMRAPYGTTPQGEDMRRRVQTDGGDAQQRQQESSSSSSSGKSLDERNCAHHTETLLGAASSQEGITGPGAQRDFSKAPSLSSLLSSPQDAASSPLPHTPRRNSPEARKKTLWRISAAALFISTLITIQLYREYKNQPQNSIVDNIVLFLNGGKPYRDYMDLSDFADLENGTYSLVTKDPAFSIRIPKDLFLRPGIIFADHVPDPSYGMLEISDVFGNYLSWSWSRLEGSTVARIMSDPRAFTKKIESYAHLMLEKHQDEGFIIMHEEILRRNPETGRWESSTPINGGTNPNDVLQDHVVPYFHTFVMVNDKDQNEPGYFTDEPHLLPSSEHWQACSFFVHDGHIFVASTAYPNNLINFAIMREHVLEKQLKEPQCEHVQQFESGIVKYLERIENMRARNRMVSTINESTFEHDRIITKLRDMLFERMNEFVAEKASENRMEIGEEGDVQSTDGATSER